MRSGIKITAISLFLLTLVLSAGAQGRMTPKEYIEKYYIWAVEDQDIYGIPASITLAQGLLESDCGNSRLAVLANNHFGIKCKSDWKGETILHDDDAPQECFRKYRSVEDSYRDHSEFLDKSPRYQKLFDLEITDYKGWAHGLRECGYATNPRYGELLIKIIEENELYRYDTGELLTDRAREELPPVIETPVPPVVAVSEPEPAARIDVDNYAVSMRTVGGYTVYSNNGSEFIQAAPGDTYSRLASVSGVSEKKLRKFNDATETSQPAAGEQVYIKAKPKRANNGKLIHTVREGDTMRSISQEYGIKLQGLSNMNRRRPDSVLSPGQQIRLR